MNELHDILRDIVLAHGADMLGQRRLVNIFIDVAPPPVSQRYRRILRQSVADGVGAELLALHAAGGDGDPMRLKTLRSRFIEQNFFVEGMADYIVDAFRYALGEIDQLAPYKPEADTAPEGDYVGQRSHNMRWGLGCRVDQGSCGYAGQWQFDRPRGLGVQVEAGGNGNYAGQWSGGYRHGRGMVFMPTGEAFCVSYDRGQIDTGRHSVFFAKDGSMVVGKMGSKGPDGECIRILPNGTIKREIWDNGQPESPQQ